MDAFKKIKIIEYRDNAFSEKKDSIASEKRLKILLNNKEILSILCTPTMVKELVVGFALSEGLLLDDNNKEREWCTERIEIFWKDEEVEVNLPVDLPETGATLTSGCAKGVTFLTSRQIDPLPEDDFRVSSSEVFELYKEFQEKSGLFRETGGVHSAALCDGKEIIVFAEDIGRHNAVDKIAGYAFLENIPTNRKIMLLSGRLSSEIATKAVRDGVPILVSRAAPTDRAVEIARKYNITMVGFLRGQHMNIYSAPERITK